MGEEAVNRMEVARALSPCTVKESSSGWAWSKVAEWEGQVEGRKGENAAGASVLHGPCQEVKSWELLQINS